MKFTKMHGLGNDFIFFENPDNIEMNYQAMAINMCHRQLGIGGDGIVVVLPSNIADLRMRIINADGSEANMCGNAIRCFARYAYERGLVQSKTFRIETFAGIIIPEVITDKDKVVAVRVNMEKPNRSNNYAGSKMVTELKRHKLPSKILASILRKIWRKPENF